MGDGLFPNRLLIIDDDDAFARFVKKVAVSLGFDVITTNDPDEFRMTAKSWTPTLVILDLSMPGCDGIELLRHLARARYPAQVVVASRAGFERRGQTWHGLPAPSTGGVILVPKVQQIQPPARFTAARRSAAVSGLSGNRVLRSRTLSPSSRANPVTYTSPTTLSARAAATEITAPP